MLSGVDSPGRSAQSPGTEGQGTLVAISARPSTTSSWRFVGLSDDIRAGQAGPVVSRRGKAATG